MGTIIVNDRTNPSIYFMHIKKCAGTSLVGVARHQKDLVRLPENHANAIPAFPKEDRGFNSPVQHAGYLL